MNGEAEFRSLYVQHHPDVLAYFLRRLGREEALEAAADVFLIAWRRADDVPPGSQARLWLFGVARNVLRNRQRSERRLLRLVTKIASTSALSPPLPEAVVVRRAQDEEIIASLSRLSPADREVIMLRLWEEAAFDEIGTLLGCSRHAAEQRYAKALKRLHSVHARAGHEEASGTTIVPQHQERNRET
ncbi:MAG TPA: sigma-70 family RNA polymerase sigma factor [Acidimicrobiia bacterium]